MESDLARGVVFVLLSNAGIRDLKFIHVGVMSFGRIGKKMAAMTLAMSTKNAVTSVLTENIYLLRERTKDD